MDRWLSCILQGHLPYLLLTLEWDVYGVHFDVSLEWVWTPYLLRQGLSPWRGYRLRQEASWVLGEDCDHG